jgi:hypothetical protein
MHYRRLREVDGMTTEPRPLHTEGPKLKRFDVTRSQVVSLAETNAKLTADNARLRELLRESMKHFYADCIGDELKDKIRKELGQ